MSGPKMGLGRVGREEETAGQKKWLPKLVAKRNRCFLAVSDDNSAAARAENSNEVYTS